VDGDSSGDDFEKGLLFDSIVTDPPYDMAEAVRSARGSQGGPITAIQESEIPSSTSGVEGSRDSNTANSARTKASSSLSVNGVISTLLQIASKRLRVGGRLVFFAPHRDQVKIVRSSLSGAGVYEGGGIQEQEQGQGNEQRQEQGLEQGQDLIVAEEGPGPAGERAAVTAASAVPVAPASVAAVDMDLVGPGTGTGTGIEQKMAKRKAFKRKAKAQALSNPNTPQGQLWTPPCLSPLSFLPPLPPDLVLVEYHQQVMSPTFSRWLCVMQKVEIETCEDLP
jgi:hypothetical protein